MTSERFDTECENSLYHLDCNAVWAGKKRRGL